MNVSCEGILMRYVLDEKEAFAEIRRYLAVNDIVPEEVTMYEVQVYGDHEDQFVEIAKQVIVYSGFNGTLHRSFLIRQKSKPPFIDLSQMNDRAYHLRHEPEGLANIRDEMAKYISMLHEETNGGL